MLSALLIVFREVLEAALIVGIVLAASHGVPDRTRWVGGGVAAGGLDGSDVDLRSERGLCVRHGFGHGLDQYDGQSAADGHRDLHDGGADRVFGDWQPDQLGDGVSTRWNDRSDAGQQHGSGYGHARAAS